MKDDNLDVACSRVITSFLDSKGLSTLNDLVDFVSLVNFPVPLGVPSPALGAAVYLLSRSSSKSQKLGADIST